MSQKRFDALLADYSAVRDDERELLNQQVTLFGAVIATLTLFGALVVGLGESIGLPDEVAAAAPLVPLSLICLLQIVGSQATVRSFYARAVEREIRSQLHPVAGLGHYPDLDVLSYRELMDTLNSLSRGGRIPRVLTIIVFASVAVIFIGLVIYMARDFGFYLKVAMLVFYGIATLMLLTEAIRATVFGRAYFQSIVKYTTIRKSQPLTPPAAPAPSGERSLFSYLVLPRPSDLSKSPFFILGALTLISSAPHFAREQFFWQRTTVLFVVLELLVYQCRYQWNDLRGLAEDLASPAAEGRGRIPIGDRSVSATVWIVLTAMAFRIFLAFMTCAFSFVSFFQHVLPMFLGVFVLGAIYEYLRSRERKAYVETSSGPLRSAGRTTVFWVCVVVGLGYPLRASMGFFLSGITVDPEREVPWDWKWPKDWHFEWSGLSFPATPANSVIMLLLFFTVGIVFVSMTWCLEAGSYSAKSWRHGSVTRIVLRRDIAKKPHLLTMLRQTDWVITTPEVPTSAGSTISTYEGRKRKWIKEHSKLFAIWNVATILAIAIGIWYAYATWQPDKFGVMQFANSAMVLALATAVVTTRALGVLSRFILWSLLLLLSIVQVYSMNGGWPLHWHAGETLGDTLPTMSLMTILSLSAIVTPVFVYKFFENASYSDLSLPDLKWRTVVLGGAHKLARLLVGKDTADRM